MTLTTLMNNDMNDQILVSDSNDLMTFINNHMNTQIFVSDANDSNDYNDIHDYLMNNQTIILILMTYDYINNYDQIDTSESMV